MKNQVLFAAMLVLVITGSAPAEGQSQKSSSRSIAEISHQLLSPTASPTETIVPTPTSLPTEIETATPTQTETPTQTQTATPTSTETITPSSTPNPLKPFFLRCEHRNPTRGESVQCQTDPVPAGKRFVVEYMSGLFSVTVIPGNLVDKIYAHDMPQSMLVFLPIHFAGEEFNVPTQNFGLVRGYQFGSPVKLYIDAGRKIHFVGYAVGFSYEIKGWAVGYLVNL